MKNVSTDSDSAIVRRFLAVYLDTPHLWPTARCPNGYGVPGSNVDIVWRAVCHGAHPSLFRLLVGAEAHGLRACDSRAFLRSYREALEEGWSNSADSGLSAADHLEAAIASIQLGPPGNLGLCEGVDVSIDTLTLLEYSEPGRRYELSGVLGYFEGEDRLLLEYTGFEGRPTIV
ncbi:hypothetical protein J8273_7619, partial [Carpediemonas membranifera]